MDIFCTVTTRQRGFHNFGGNLHQFGFAHGDLGQMLRWFSFQGVAPALGKGSWLAIICKLSELRCYYPKYGLSFLGIVMNNNNYEIFLFSKSCRGRNKNKKNILIFSITPFLSRILFRTLNHQYDYTFDWTMLKMKSAQREMQINAKTNAITGGQPDESHDKDKQQQSGSELK